MWPLASLLANTCCLRETDVNNYLTSYFGAKCVICFAFIAQKHWKAFLEVRFHKQLHDYKEIRFSNRPGKLLRIKFSFHMHVMKKLFGETFDLLGITRVSVSLQHLEAKFRFCWKFRISSDANIIDKSSLTKLGLKTVNRSSKFCFYARSMDLISLAYKQSNYSSLAVRKRNAGSFPV